MGHERRMTWAGNGQLVPEGARQYFACRKKPVQVQAFVAPEPILIETLEGTMLAEAGDFVICGVRGEHYPCKPGIFWATYERLDDFPSDKSGE